jgi:hypothetical protein
MSLYSLSSSSLSSKTARHGVLRLYKNCLISALRIPDPSQRAVYIEYTRGGFRHPRARNLVAESFEAIRAMEAAQEQLESMNYYHSIRELKKERAAEYPTTHVNGDNNTGVLASVDAAVDANSTQKDGWKSTSDNHDDQDQSRSQPVGFNQGDLIITEAGNDLIRKQKLLVVETWLLLALPELHPNDLSAYSHRLMEDGFDSLTLLQMDLVPADLEFMKKAHQRAIVRAYPI